MKKVLLTIAMLWACLAFAHAQTLPTITSATYHTVAPIGDSPNSAVTVRVNIPTVNGVNKVYVTVTDGSNNVLHTQQYPANLVAVRTKDGACVLSLKFFTDASLTGSTVKVALEDANEIKGAAFTASAQ